MPATEDFFDAIDRARIQRARELSEIKRTFHATAASDPLAIGSKSVVVLTYAIWEGFYNECVNIYIDFMVFQQVKVAETSWLLLVGAMSSDFKSLRDRHHSSIAKQEFVRRLRDCLDCSFDSLDRSVVMARSNLDFGKLDSNLKILDISVLPFVTKRIRIDRELVGWRHSVAHGSPPNLSALDVNGHIEFASELLLELSDAFQSAILKHI
jgi:hypothetical protein